MPVEQLTRGRGRRASSRALAAEIARHDRLYYRERRARDLGCRLRPPAPAQPGDRGALSRSGPARQPAHRVGAPPVADFGKVRHRVPMLSLDNAMDGAEVVEFLRRVRRFLNLGESTPLAAGRRAQDRRPVGERCATRTACWRRAPRAATAASART